MLDKQNCENCNSEYTPTLSDAYEYENYCSLKCELEEEQK